MKITTAQQHITTMDDGTSITMTTDDEGLHIAIKEPDSSKHIGKTVTIHFRPGEIQAFVDTFNVIASRFTSVLSAINKAIIYGDDQPYSELEMAQQDVARLTAELEGVALKCDEYRSAHAYVVALLNGPELSQEQWDAEVRFLSARLA